MQRAAWARLAALGFRMNFRNNIVLIRWVAVLPLPFIIALFSSQSAYWFGSILSAWFPAKVSILVGLVIGVAGLSFFNFKGPRIKALCLVLYALVLFVFLGFVQFLTACANGDCL